MQINSINRRQQRVFRAPAPPATPRSAYHARPLRLGTHGFGFGPLIEAIHRSTHTETEKRFFRDLERRERDLERPDPVSRDSLRRVAKYAEDMVETADSRIREDVGTDLREIHEALDALLPFLSHVDAALRRTDPEYEKAAGPRSRWFGTLARGDRNWDAVDSEDPDPSSELSRASTPQNQSAQTPKPKWNPRRTGHV